MNPVFEFDEESYDAVDAAGVDVVTVLAVLHGHPQHRQHIGGSGLVITARTPNGRWLMVGLTERPERDDVYVVREVMAPDQRQTDMIAKRFERFEEDR